MSLNIVPVILAGGAGKRIWPLSKYNNPKQFLKIFNSKSLFELTIENIIHFHQKNKKIIKNPIIVTNEEYRFFCNNQLRTFSLKSHIILEPESKNTANSIALAAKLCEEKYPNSLMLVMSSDHIIENKDKMFLTVSNVVNHIVKKPHSLGLIGVKPLFPSIEYGYFETSKINSNIFEVKNFFEKPTLAKAKKYINKHYLWNAGIFVLSSNFYLDFIATDKRFKNNLNLCWHNKTSDLNFYRPDHKFFKNLNKISFDYYFVEKLKKLKIPIFSSILYSNWNDLGSWSAIEKNIKLSNKSFDIKAKNNFILSDRTSIINGVNDLIVYLDKDFLFISDKKSYKKNSKLIENLKKENKVHLESVNEIHRPWGFYEILDKKDNFLTKKITIYPNTKLSYQKHNHRSEHWVVISGVINVVINDRTHTLKKNQSIDIPKKSKHRMINESKKIAEVIEVQLGKIISEDDIIRYEDEYDRS